MATTTNYGWTTPDDTALVKDGAAAIRTLGSSIDTTTKNLNPETTLGDISYRSSTANVNTRLPLGTAGQVLKVNSGATAPEWSSDNAGMTNPMTTTGDTIYSSSGSTPARLGIGSTGQVLTVAAGLPSWAAPVTGGQTLLQSLSLSGSSTTSSTFSSAYNEILIYMKGVVNSSVASGLMRINGDSGSNYTYRNIAGESSGIYTTGNTSTTSYDFGLIGSTTTQLLKGFAIISIMRPSDTDSVVISSVDLAYDGGSNRNYQTLGTYDGTAAVTSLTFLPASGTWSSGTAEIYGVK